VDHVVPADGFEAGVAEIVERYLRAPRAASIATKRLMGRAFDASFETVFEESRALLEECLASPEASTAIDEWRRREAT
jgi:enoyl-CoA hydratase/carnithine racemase